MLGIDHLLTLARAYAEATGSTLNGVGHKSCGNNRLFLRLADGKGANILSMNRAAQWLADNWPRDLPWPANVPRIAPTPTIRKPRRNRPARRQPGEVCA